MVGGPKVNGRRGARNATSSLVEVDLGGPNWGIGPHQEHRGWTRTSRTAANIPGSMGLTGGAVTESTSNPLIVVRRIFERVD